jgi:hypothetical protein
MIKILKRILKSKRRGVLLKDAMIALMLIVVFVIPVSAAIAFVYSTIIDSAGMSDALNEFYDEIDARILANIFGDTAPLGDPAGTIQIIENASGDYINANLRRAQRDLVLRRASIRRVSVEVFIIQNP